MIMFPSMDSWDGEILQDASKDSVGSISSIQSLKRKKLFSQFRKIPFATIPDISSSEESDIPKTFYRSTINETSSETDYFSCLKFPNVKGSFAKKTVNQVNLGEILSIIEPVSKQMEKDKKIKVEPYRPKISTYDADVDRVGPHVDIYIAFQPQLRKRKGKISKKVLKAIILIQAAARGWLVRRRLARVIIKAKDHGPSFRAVVNAYRRMVDRIQRRAGLRYTRVILNFSELEEWLDRKKFYEVMFAKREYYQGIPLEDLPKYFRDCGHFPSQSHIESTYQLVQKFNEMPSEEVKKSKAIEMIFTLYPPEGAHVSHFWGLKSTWTRPIVNGEEAYKYIVSGHPIIKKADIRIVGKLVARSMRERRMKIRFKSSNE
ncbi:IQ domain-containing protein M isoform X2 [Sarcophilus harrisii]|uniref:IQ domain-containing protein M isoform X2 n=1 Tax=Sarcophilus harrisii TaxID=9305 RepID=UPI0013020B27|nr:IQ domain-containing protein M isoform X2 [Sarcophilus harrisii]